MRSKLFLFLGAMCFSLLMNAQRNCGSMEYLDHQRDNDPKMQTKMDRIEEQTQRYIESADRAVNGVITIPVVVHVVYNNSTENISDAQIQTQIDVLNEDFRRTNSDADNTWSQAADTEIEFCLATTDPNGNSTNGITRTSTSVTSFSTSSDNVKFNSTGGKDAWPAGDYMNLWVCDISSGILGYAQFPGGAASTDGIVCDYQYFGTIGTATAPFNLGRTTTHEVGHWLNLRHIWGDGPCSADDFVSDTPSSDNPNYGCALGHVSCSSTDMVQNYMDYSDDACMNLYTQGQKTRMRALFDTGGFRESLLSSSACGPAGPPATCDDGIQNQGETGVDCGGPNCAPCPCNGTNVNLTIVLDNYPEETSWSISADGGGVVASGGTYGSQPDGSTVSVDLCLGDGCYTFTINDSYGDGICCSYGSGSYSLTGGGNTLASGGSFGSSESTNFCLGGGPAPTCNDGIQNQGETGIDCGGPCAACPSCNDGIQNQGETGVDCGGPCAACPTCNDGIQNQGETGIDCGGPCAPCGGGGCTYEVINFNNFDSGWGIWNDGGSDCRRSSNDAAYSYSSPRSVRLRDNTSSSVTTTDNLNLTAYDEITVEFFFYARSMETNEDFWLQISTNGGSSYTTVADYNSGSTFNNNTFYTDEVVISGPFSSSTRLRFRCDASTNSDYVYIDDVTISGCYNGAREAEPATESIATVTSETGLSIDNLNLYPNPANDALNISFDLAQAGNVGMMVYDLSGRLVINEQFQRDAGNQLIKLPLQELEVGTYILQLTSMDGKAVKRFVIQR